MENKVKVWLARDINGSIFVHATEPFKVTSPGEWVSYNSAILPDRYFPSVKWEDDEPTEAYITLANEPQEQPKKEIDWEQRMAEIAESIFVTEQPYINCEEEVEKYAEIAIQRAKILIDKLKNQSYNA